MCTSIVKMGEREIQMDTHATSEHTNAHSLRGKGESEQNPISTANKGDE